MTRLKFSLVCGVAAIAMATGGALPTIAHAEDVARDLPLVLRPISREATAAPVDPTPAPGDNLGDHRATQTLNMGGHGMQNVGAITAMSAHIAGRLVVGNVQSGNIDLKNTGKILNMRDPTLDTDGISFGYMKRYIAGLPSTGDNLGNHRATMPILMNEQAILTGKVVSAPGDPLVVEGGVMIQGAAISGLATPVNPSDAATKGYIDGLIANVGGVDTSGFVNTTTAQSVGGVKSFTSVINAAAGIDAGSSKITNAAGGTADTDVPNVKNVKDLIAASAGTTLAAGSGIMITGTTTKTVAVDSSVVRTTGNQTIMGLKNFTDGPVYVNGLGNNTVVLKLRSSNSVMDATSQESDVFPAAIKTLRNHGFSINAGSHPSPTDHAANLEMEGWLPTTNPAGAAYDSALVNIRLPYRSGYLGSTTGTASARELADTTDLNGLVASFAYRNIFFKRHVDVDGGLKVSSSTPNRRAVFDVPMVGSQGLTVSPGAGEVRFNSTVFGHQFTTFSDERLKENVETLSGDDAAEILKAIRPVSYDLKDSGKHAYGVIAQEIQKVMPWAVEETSDNLLTVDYIQIIPPLAATVVALEAENNDLEGKLSETLAKMESLEERFLALEAAVSAEK